MRDFLASEATGGILLIAATALAMIAANLPGIATGYFHLLHVETGPVLSGKLGPMTVHLWINDGLMAVDRKSTRLNSSHSQQSRMPSSA